MSGVTMAQLLAADPTPFHQAAYSWAHLADELDSAYEQFRRGLKLVDQGWPAGSAAQAAAQTLTAQAHELSNAHHPAKQIATALERHAYTVDDLRTRAEEIMLIADRTGCRIDPTTGAVSIVATDALADDATAADEVRIAKAVAQVQREVDDLLGRARRLDDETATALRSNQPAPGYGFGAQPDWRVDRDMVTQELGRSPKDVHDWWLGLSPEQQAQALQDYPDLLGPLNGIPAVDRDQANRINLPRELEAAQEEVAMREQKLREARERYPSGVAAAETLLAVAKDQVTGLQRVQEKLDQLGDHAFLLGIDRHGVGRAIIAVGNPDTAAHTAVFVPGVNTDLLDIGGDMDRVTHLQHAADVKTPMPDDVSVVYWLGYEAPVAARAPFHQESEDGAAAFTPFVDGLRATHEPSGDPYHITAVGHSYGSAVIAESALSGQLHVDDIVTAGSPGMHTDHAADLHLDPRHVWGGAAEGDLIAGAVGEVPVLGHGQEPTDPDFGANRYVVDTEGHSAYWREGSESLENQADIVVGQYNKVTLVWGSQPPS